MRYLTVAGLPLTAAALLAGITSAQELTGDPWSDMDYGPFKVHSYIVEPGNNTNKGIAIRVDEGPGGVAKGTEFLLFDTDTLRWAAGWTGSGFMDWNSINYNGRHEIEPAIVGDIVFTNPDAPGWSRAGDDFRDTRIVGRGGRRFGPQERAVARWLGHYLHGSQVVLSYRVGGADVLELGASDGFGAFSRTLNIGPRNTDLAVQVAYQEGGKAWAEGDAAGFRTPRSSQPADAERSGPLVAAMLGAPDGARWEIDDGNHLRLRVPAGAEPVRFKIVVGPRGRSNSGFLARARQSAPAADLEALTHGGPAHWTETVQTESRVLGRRDGPFALEAITAPLDNPYQSWMRLGGFDFLDGGRRAVVATWMGDVWIVDGLGGEEIGAVTWKRFATGMYEPLGVNTRDGEIFVTSRDQITRLHDLNGDGEADHYEAFNHDAQASAHFHEFSVGLETDAEGNFYYAKGTGHDFDARVPQHGTILKVSADGASTEIIANGFRAPNGLVVNPDGSVIVTDQEGHWTPENRINWVEPGTFHGYMRAWREPDRHPDDFVQPVTWIHHDIDRSPSAPVRVRSERWGELDESLIYLSYGNGKMFSVLFDRAFAGNDGPPRQAAVVELPVAAAPTGLIRGRFNPTDDHLYVCGLFAWAGDRTQSGGFYRVRRTDEPLRIPVAYETARNGIVVRFTTELDPQVAADHGNYSMRIWQYLRQASYGSEDYRVLGEGVGEDVLAIPSATLSADRRSVFIEIPDILPVQQYHLEMNLRSADGERMREFIHGTIHELGSRAGSEILAGVVAAQRDAGGFEHPGLELVLRSLDSDATDARVARLAALYVPAGQAVSPFIDAGPFEATFRGAIELDLNDWYRFTVRGSGAVRLSIGGEVVLEAENLPAGGVPVSTDGEMRLNKGLNPIELVYRSPAGGDASLRLSWSNDYLPEEPVPPESLRRASSAELDHGAARRAARQLIADALCIRCHPAAGTADALSDAMPELAATAPDLGGIGSRLRRQWIERWLLDPGSVRPQARMPKLLSTDTAEGRRQAADLAAYLTIRSADDQERQAGLAPPDRVVADGRRLYNEIGCAACHGDELPALRIRDKWQPQALTAYLLDPAAADPWGPMPRIALEPAEAGALAAYLLAPASEGGAAPVEAAPTTTPPPIQGDPDRGRRLVEELRCRSCHSLGDDDPPAPAAPMSGLAAAALPWIGAGSADTNHPRYDFDVGETASIEGFLADDVASLTRGVPAEFAERRITAGGCLACHARDGIPASWSAPTASSDPPAADGTQDDLAFLAATPAESGPDLLPPALTWAGEKLRSDWLEDFLAGRTVDRPRPHLRARMPTFASHPGVLAAGLHHQHGLPASTVTAEPADEALAAIGRDLIRGDRLGCHSCHALGDQPALGGEGSEETINFALVRRRLRRSYFDRFLRDPQRILPGTKMPQFVDEDGYTGLYDVFDGEAERQFEAIWQYLGSLD